MRRRRQSSAVYGQPVYLHSTGREPRRSDAAVRLRAGAYTLLSTGMAIRAGTNDLYIVTSDGPGGQGATMFRVICQNPVAFLREMT